MHPKAKLVPPLCVDPQPLQGRRQRGDGRRPGIEIRRRRSLQNLLELGGPGDEGEERRVGLRETRDEHDVLVGLPDVAHDAVPTHPVVTELAGAALTDHAEPMRVVDVQERVVLAREPGEGGDVGRVSRHAVHAVHADQSRWLGVGLQQALEVLGIRVREPKHGGAVPAGDRAAVVDRLVRPAVKEDGPAPREDGNDGHVDERDRRQCERVLCTDELGQLRLELFVEHRASQQTRPARMRPPMVQVRGDRIDDAPVQIQPEVIAGREVRQPMLADPDHAPVDLVDHGVRHWIRARQLGQIPTGVKPAVDPARGRKCGPVRAATVHRPRIGSEGPKL